MQNGAEKRDRKDSHEGANRDENELLREPKGDQKGHKIELKSLWGLSWSSPGHPRAEGGCPKAFLTPFWEHFGRPLRPPGPPLEAPGGQKEAILATKCAHAVFFVITLRKQL